MGEKKRNKKSGEGLIQDELEKYWDQHDRTEKLLVWLVIHQRMVGMLLESIEEIRIIPSKWGALLKQLPDISDILKEYEK